ncbi:MAG: S8 family serine peptidase [Verrucomicrobia bacterium]|nr:S8 family serine peptidase [Verrucomicrobiota bacterium]
MRPRPMLWFVISLLCMAGAFYCWRLGNKWAAQKRDAAPVAVTNQTVAPAGTAPVSNTNAVAAPAPVTAVKSNSFLAHRLTNTPRPYGDLLRDNKAILLENALIDTALPLNFNIPDHLRFDGDPGSYIVKLRGPFDKAFREVLAEVGAEFVSYIPNDAVLVRASTTAAGQLKTASQTLAVYPWEPVYKLKSELLVLGVDNKPLPDGKNLTVVLFAGSAEATREQLRRNAVEIISEDHSPFGPIVTVTPPADWLSLARMPGVQLMELSRQRGSANDLTRARLTVAADTRTTTNYLGLTGSDITVSVNDSGVDASHPDLGPRVVGTATTDPDGHGTHVAGIIASSGLSSTTVSNAYGSIMPGTNGQFRGMSPGATIFSQAAISATNTPTDYILQERAAREDALISNNSWGYIGASSYDIHASSFDQATRDALPDTTGPQPLLFVFTAGNEGGGDDEGLSGSSGSVTSPGTAKNVITVGATELARNITNIVVDADSFTNAPWEGMTSSQNEIAWFSSRGNSGIGIEGDFGRFKPDVVAPGTFVVSTRSTTWDQDAYYAPPNGDYWDVFRTNLNAKLGPLYRYESGTSMAAASVAGTLALMQEFFEKRMQPDFGPTKRPSPALMKALLINGSRSVGSLYDFQVQNSINYQGWGLVRLRNSLHSNLTNGIAAPTNSLKFYEQSPAAALATGESVTRYFSFSDAARTVPMRVTLVWTDPPGNPAAGIKLVNDLDLVVTNLDTQEVFIGNDIGVGRNFVFATDFTNAPPTNDIINNVENVYISPTLGTNYSITVTARRVNVNAVTTHPDDIVQDYALVISSGNGEFPNAFTVSDTPITGGNTLDLTPLSNTLTNDPTRYAGSFVLGQHVGANSPILGSTVTLTNGQRSQWHFYSITNTTTFTNAAFVTFLPATLAIPQIGVRQETNADNATRFEADIDLYVATDDPTLLNLDAITIANSDKSRQRGGTEVVILTNSGLNKVYYIGVKSEDQMAAEYALLGLFSRDPFNAKDGDNYIPPFFPLPSAIPDGNPAKPGIVRFISPGPTDAAIVRRLVMTNSFFHENMGDLVGILTHNRQSVALNNHRSAPPGFYTFVYEDNDEEPANRVYIHPDGPGKLRNFVGERGSGPWFLTMVDNANSQTGFVSRVDMRLEPSASGGDSNIVHTIQPNAFFFEVVDVPVGATNLTVCVYNVSTTQVPLELYIRRDEFPTRTEYDYFKIMFPPNDCLTVTPQDLPPLQRGRYFIGVFNPSALEQQVRIGITVGVDLDSVTSVDFGTAGESPTFDDAVTNSTIFVATNSTIAQVEVGVRLQHPRVSDLALTLISPKGTRVLLTENRGGLDPEGFGGGASAITNVAPTVSAGGQAESSTNINTGVTSGFIDIDYDFFTVPDFLRVYYDGLLIFDTGLTNGHRRVTINYGPGTDTFVRIVVNEVGGNTNATTAWTYTVSSIIGDDTFLLFTDNTNRTTTPMKFLAPPYTPLPAAPAAIFSDFDAAAVASYVVPQVVDTWNVLTSNRVAVFNEPGLVRNGNSLALLSGSMDRFLPTKPDTKYQLNFAYRKAKFLEGLVSWWPGESNTVDIVGGDDGTLFGNAGFKRGLVATGFNYDGVDDYMTVNGLFPFHTTNSASFEFWVNPNGDYGVNAYQCLFWTRSTATPDEDRFNFYIRPDSTFNFDYRSITGNYHPLIGDIPVASNAWTHLAITRTGLDTYTLYTNGVAAASVVDATPELPTPSPGWRFSGLTYDEHEFNGQLDEVAIYNRALTPFEIADIYAAGAAGKCGMITPPDVCPLAGGTLSIPNGPTNNFLGTSNWAGGGLFFTAAFTNTQIRLTPTGGGRFYEFVRATNNISWGEAQLAAQSFVRAGMRGHLAVITSAAENEFIRTNFSTSNLNEFAWIGGREPTNDGSWFWDAGPEVGQQFSSNNVPTAPYNYANWATGQPDNSSTNEDYLTFNLGLDSGGITNGQWADAPPNPGTNNPVVGYIVEYEPPNSGVYVDDFTLTELDDALYVLPETALDALKGESAQGTWTLEILDRRTGATNLVSVLRDWQLRFVFESSGPIAIPLQHGIPHTNTVAASSITVPANSIAYYTVDVPPWALFATNSILFASQPVNLIFNQTIPPLTGAGDITFLANTTGGSATMSTTNLGPLLPGRRYYLAVQNTTNVAANFAIEVDFDITPLVNHVPQTNALGLAFQKYYFYDVSTNATAVQYRLYNMNGNANLVARKGLPLPTIAGYDVGSFNPGNFDEDILLFTNSTPVALTPGRWYLGVFPADVTPVTFTIVADEFTNAFPNIITLTNRIPYANTNSGAGLLADYYRFVVSTNAVRAQFEINNPSADMTLLLRKGLPLPDVGLFDYVSANGYTNDELIILYTNSAPVRLSPGNWFLSALNISGGPVTYSIKASEYTAEEVGIGIVITNVFLSSNSFCMTWTSLPGAHYFVEGKPDLVVTNWDIVSPTITAIDYSTTWCLALPSPYQFFRVAEGIVVNPYTPPIVINNITVTPGAVVLRWTAPASASFNVQWTPTLVPTAWTSFTNIITSPTGLFQFTDDGTQTGGLGGTRYYRLLQLP